MQQYSLASQLPALANLQNLQNPALLQSLNLIQMASMATRDQQQQQPSAQHMPDPLQNQAFLANVYSNISHYQNLLQNLEKANSQLSLPKPSFAPSYPTSQT